jgi:Zn-dependent peptidase ImmA (M78 family)
MSTITEQLFDTVDFLIHRYHLHSRLPVDLGPLLEKFEIRGHNFTPMTMGYALVRPKQIYIGINQNLDPGWQRLAQAHEAAHIIANQQHPLFVCKTNDWSKDHDEREAHLIAACLLVPLRVVEENYRVGIAPQLAKALRVPPNVIDDRWAFARVHGDI